MNERDLVSRILKELRRRNGWWVKIHGGPFQLVGLPDIIGCYEGLFYGIEVKLPGKEGTLTKRQSFILEQIRQSGKGQSGMVTSVEEAVALIYEPQKVKN